MTEKGLVMEKYLILTGGHVDSGFLKELTERERFDRIICADRGLLAADRLGLAADYLVGDFDSLPEEVLETYRHKIESGELRAVLREYNPVKDATDTEIALTLALEQGAGEIIIAGGTGTRLDHVLGNLSLLAKALKQGVKACLLDEYNKIYLIDRETRIRKEEQYGKFVSLIPYMGMVPGVKLDGFAYELAGTDFDMGNALGISNEITAEEGRIRFDGGILIVVEARDKKRTTETEGETER